ncbi:MAG: hypothetical protein MK135_16540 [Polyangiaceae bacterium]|nr:hypothetical protein [Polyangiaceae bacterium]
MIQRSRQQALALLVGSTAVSVSLIGCQRPEAKACRAEMLAMKEPVGNAGNLDLPELKKLQDDLQQLALDCNAAGLAQEAGDVTEAFTALNKIAELKAKGGDKSKAARGPEQLKALIANGDPSCPAGLVYKIPPVGQQVKCTGPQFVEMPKQMAVSYFSARDASLEKDNIPHRLKAKAGDETWQFYYDDTDQKVLCLESMGAVGVGWQEVVRRLTGVHPAKLKEGAPVPMKSGPLALSKTQKGDQVAVQLGDCQAFAATDNGSTPASPAGPASPEKK